MWRLGSLGKGSAFHMNTVRGTMSGLGLGLGLGARPDQHWSQVSRSPSFTCSASGCERVKQTHPNRDLVLLEQHRACAHADRGHICTQIKTTQ